jgi:hypothetical protein
MVTCGVFCTTVVQTFPADFMHFVFLQLRSGPDVPLMPSGDEVGIFDMIITRIKLMTFDTGRFVLS